MGSKGGEYLDRFILRDLTSLQAGIGWWRGVGLQNGARTERIF